MSNAAVASIRISTLFANSLTCAVFSLKAEIANTCERVHTIHTSSIASTLDSYTVINVDATVPTCVPGSTRTSVVIDEVLYL